MRVVLNTHTHTCRFSNPSNLTHRSRSHWSYAGSKWIIYKICWQRNTNIIFSNTPLDYLKHASAFAAVTDTRRGMDMLKVQCSINTCEFEKFMRIILAAIRKKCDCVQKVERKFQNRALLGKTHYCYGWFPYHVDPNHDVKLCGFFYLSGSFVPKNYGYY